MTEKTQFNQLSRKSIKAWRINGALWSLLIWLVPLFVIFLNYFEANLPLFIILVLVGIAVFLTILLVFVIPEIRWRQWRYKVDEHEIDLHHGIWFTRRTLVPVKRVQHVDTRQGPVLRNYQLADVVISTAATTHKIPALASEIADQLRSEISTFARKAKEDV